MFSLSQYCPRKYALIHQNLNVRSLQTKAEWNKIFWIFYDLIEEYIISPDPPTPAPTPSLGAHKAAAYRALPYGASA